MDGQPFTAPHTFASVVGFERPIGAAATPDARRHDLQLRLLVRRRRGDAHDQHAAGQHDLHRDLQAAPRRSRAKINFQDDDLAGLHRLRGRHRAGLRQPRQRLQLRLERQQHRQRPQPQRRQLARRALRHAQSTCRSRRTPTPSGSSPCPTAPTASASWPATRATSTASSGPTSRACWRLNGTPTTSTRWFDNTVHGDGQRRPADRPTPPGRRTTSWPSSRSRRLRPCSRIALQPAGSRRADWSGRTLQRRHRHDDRGRLGERQHGHADRRGDVGRRAAPVPAPP